ncbi:GspE/PulE family protein [Pectobacterium atrosepticum]|uniref:GspE/PulE family protein n=1 Tax=Pectobacterium atrosepticum TaxID=29471 RepID=UPI003017312D
MTDIIVEESLLLVNGPEGQEILIDVNERGNQAVQAKLVDLMTKHPKVPIRHVSLSDLRSASEKNENKTLHGGSEGLRLSDLVDVSGSEQKVLNYFKIAKSLEASDIHFSISDSLFQVKMRCYGELVIADERQPSEGTALCGTAILSMSDVTESMFFSHREQDARLSPLLMKKIGLFGARYSHRPTGDGLIAVMRLIPDDGNKVPSFLQLGFLPEQISILRKMISMPEGKIILSGPTGSGKSTTLRSACRHYLDNNIGRHLLTIEDPLEGQIKGAIQTPIVCDKSDEEEVKLAWSRALSSAMRLDPDAIMVGELRDLTSMNAAIYAAQTGHLVLTTLHTNSALGIPERMITRGVNADIICDAQLLIGLISQRLVPTLCSFCRIPWNEHINKLSANDKEFLSKYLPPTEEYKNQNIYFRNIDGCKECNHDVIVNGQTRATVGRGIKGRTVIAEVIEPNNQLFHLLKKHGKVKARQYWLKEMKGISRLQHLLRKINEGVVDPLLATRIIPLDEDERLEIADE